MKLGSRDVLATLAACAMASQQATALDQKLSGINYSPLVSQWDDVLANGTVHTYFGCPTKEKIESEVEAVAAIADRIKIFRNDVCALADIVTSKADLFKEILYAVWVNEDGSVVSTDVEALIETVRKYKLENIEVLVGSEFIERAREKSYEKNGHSDSASADKEMKAAGELLYNAMKNVEAQLHKAGIKDTTISTSDTNALWMNADLFPQLKTYLKNGYINQYGYWTCTPPVDSANAVMDVTTAWEGAWGFKLNVGEHGFASSDNSGKNAKCGSSFASSKNAQLYYESILKASQNSDVVLYAFELQDQEYRKEGEWGLANSSFILKPFIDDINLTNGTRIVLPKVIEDNTIIMDDGTNFLKNDTTTTTTTTTTKTPTTSASSPPSPTAEPQGSTTSTNSPDDKNAAHSVSISTTLSLMLVTLCSVLAM
jgi:exo-beta-1,3-glucanase (GH17 family)